MHDRDTGAVGTVNQCRLHLTSLKQYQFNYNFYFMFLCTNKMDANAKRIDFIILLEVSLAGNEF